MVHFRPSLSATKDAGMTPTKLTTAMAANSSPAQPGIHRLQHMTCKECPATEHQSPAQHC